MSSVARADHLEHADEILNMLEAGRSLRDICAGDSRFPHRQAFVRALNHRPALRERYQAAVAKWSAPHARSLIHFNEIERRIIAGGAVSDVLASGPSFPDDRSFRLFRLAHPDYDARYRAALRAREAGPNARGIVPKYSDQELKEAAEKLAATGTRYISIKRIAPNGPHTSTLMAARYRNAELCAVIEKAMITRIVRLKIKDGPLFKPLTPGLILPRRRTPRVVYQKHLLVSSLRQNDIFALADAAVPKYLSPFDRDDIIAQTVLEVIEDDLDLDMVASVAKEITAEHYREKFGRDVVSIDKSLRVDSTFTLADVLSNNWD
jgi:hypothetical protein